jgi:hypothetical protein
MVALVVVDAWQESPEQGWFILAHGVDPNEGELVGDMETPIDPDRSYTILELEELDPCPVEKRKVLVEQIHTGMPTEVFHASFLLGHSHGVRGCPLGRGPTSAAAVEDLLFYSNFELLAGVSQIMRDDLTIEERML